MTAPVPSSVAAVVGLPLWQVFCRGVLVATCVGVAAAQAALAKNALEHGGAERGVYRLVCLGRRR